SRLDVPPKRDMQAIREPQLPCEARCYDDALELRSERRKDLGEASVPQRYLALGACRTEEERQRPGRMPRKPLTVRIHQLVLTPACKGHVLLEGHFKAIGPYPAYGCAAYPR